MFFSSKLTILLKSIFRMMIAILDELVNYTVLGMTWKQITNCHESLIVTRKSVNSQFWFFSKESTFWFDTSLIISNNQLREVGRNLGNS